NRLVIVTGDTNRLQIILCVCSALGLAQDVIHLLGRCYSTLSLARLAQVLVASQDALPQLLPLPAISSCVAALARPGHYGSPPRNFARSTVAGLGRLSRR